MRARLLLVVGLVLALSAPAWAQERVVVKGKTYVTGRSLGGGRWARVYEGRPEGGGPRVAIKIETARDPSQPEGNTFKRELRVMEQLKGKHESLPAHVYGIGKVEGSGKAALVTELIDGAPVPSTLTAHEAVDMTLQLLGGVGEMHRQGLWHADINPPNVLRDQKGGIHLIDFGRTLKIEEPREGSGYPGFTAPEVLDTNQKRGDLQDIHAIGGVLAHSMSSKPAALAPVIDKAMNHDPAQRYQSTSEFRDALLKAREALKADKTTTSK